MGVKGGEIEKRQGRGSRSRSRRRSWRFPVFPLLVLAAVCTALVVVGRRYPFDTLISVAIVAGSAMCVVVYIGQLVVIGWVMDLVGWIVMPKTRAKQPPLEYEQVGEIIVVKLTDNVVTLGQCQAVLGQLRRLIDQQNSDFILDFSGAGKVSIGFRGVMIRAARAASRKARALGRPYRPMALPRGDVFRVFADRQGAIEEMDAHGGHGWVVLCCVPAGMRSVPEAM
jgi:hypothetical protein